MGPKSIVNRRLVAFVRPATFSV